MTKDKKAGDIIADTIEVGAYVASDSLDPEFACVKRHDESDEDELVP